MTKVILLLSERQENIVNRYFGLLILSGALIIPVAANAQDRDHRDNQSNRYEDKAHHDSHEWNDRESQEYRRYLQEHHKKEHEFSNASKREQNDYWNWRHSHPDNDRR
jgi:type III secretory pathway component EscR